MELTYSLCTFCLKIVKMYGMYVETYCAPTCCWEHDSSLYTVLGPWLCGQNKCKQEAKSPRHERPPQPKLHGKNVCKAVLRIRDILVRIRIRIRIIGSVFLTNGSGCGSGRPKNMRIREAQKHADPDPKHWLIYIILQR
jgi:hypothetical protein